MRPLALQLLALIRPGLRGLLGLTPLTLLDSAVVGASALLSLVVNEATKGPWQRQHPHTLVAGATPRRYPR